ncbi:NgoFVII family restriction endonuclease [Sulfurimonas sp. SAG-AH-194-C20]|nr:restriction endonuclease PLD domain-containing protein [Sulfurimonas sp. SAG-AH-194-C20]MDF1878113.1 NgoFVII family restriction endonuclease [Sulfurimonas sp. SAG-AH-194-C20]
MELVTNNGTKKHKHHIIELIKSSDRIIISSGWMKMDGLKKLKICLDIAVKNNAKITIYSDHQNTKDGVREFLNTYKTIEHIITKKNETLHSKIYYFEQEKSFTTLIGSANITHGGLYSSDELSVKITGLIGDKNYLSIWKYLSDLSVKYQKHD